MNKQQLIENIRRKGSFLCVGLDTDLKKIPTCLLGEEDPIFAFNKAIIDATAPYCVAYKPNLAFYECFGLKGWAAFEKTVTYLRQNYPDQFVIADAKRGDIGNTSAMYARSFFEEMQLDALTVAPYMGEDSVTPFLSYEDKWVILLALTSNKGSQDFQLTEDKEGIRLFEKVLTTSQKWAGSDRMMYVVGATRGRLFEDVRRLAPKHFPVWHDVRMWLACQLLARHYLRRHVGTVCGCRCRTGTRFGRTDGRFPSPVCRVIPLAGKPLAYAFSDRKQADGERNFAARQAP